MSIGRETALRFAESNPPAAPAPVSVVISTRDVERILEVWNGLEWKALTLIQAVGVLAALFQGQIYAFRIPIYMYIPLDVLLLGILLYIY